MTNPIWKALLSLLLQGKEVRHVEPNPLTAYPRKTVLFHFADRSRFELSVPGERGQFTKWWKDAAARFQVTFSDENSN